MAVVSVTSPVGFWRGFLKLKVAGVSRRHLGNASLPDNLFLAFYSLAFFFITGSLIIVNNFEDLFLLFLIIFFTNIENCDISLLSKM